MSDATMTSRAEHLELLRALQSDKKSSVSVFTGATNHIPKSVEPLATLEQVRAIGQTLGVEADAVSVTPDAVGDTQLGPWVWNPIVFGDGVAVGGWAQLTIYQDGSVNFTGHLHDSGGISYDTNTVFTVMNQTNGNVYVVAHRGRVHGTFEAGSRDDDWGGGDKQQAIADDWGTLSWAWKWRAVSQVTADWGPVLDDIIKAVAAGQAIGKVITLFV